MSQDPHNPQPGTFGYGPDQNNQDRTHFSGQSSATEHSGAAGQPSGPTHAASADSATTDPYGHGYGHQPYSGQSNPYGHSYSGYGQDQPGYSQSQASYGQDQAGAYQQAPGGSYAADQGGYGQQAAYGQDSSGYGEQAYGGGYPANQQYGYQQAPIAEDKKDGLFSALFDLSFTSYVTPSVAKILYILLIVFGGLGWLISLISAFAQGALSGLVVLIFGGVGLFLWLLMARVMLEFYIAMIRTSQHTRDMKDLLERSDSTPPTA